MGHRRLHPCLFPSHVGWCGISSVLFKQGEAVWLRAPLCHTQAMLSCSPQSCVCVAHSPTPVLPALLSLHPSPLPSLRPPDPSSQNLKSSVQDKLYPRCENKNIWEWKNSIIASLQWWPAASWPLWPESPSDLSHQVLESFGPSCHWRPGYVTVHCAHLFGSGDEVPHPAWCVRHVSLSSHPLSSVPESHGRVPHRAAPGQYWGHPATPSSSTGSAAGSLSSPYPIPSQGWPLPETPLGLNFLWRSEVCPAKGGRISALRRPGSVYSRGITQNASYTDFLEVPAGAASRLPLLLFSVIFAEITSQESNCTWILYSSSASGST